MDEINVFRCCYYCHTITATFDKKIWKIVACIVKNVWFYKSRKLYWYDRDLDFLPNTWMSLRSNGLNIWWYFQFVFIQLNETSIVQVKSNSSLKKFWFKLFGCHQFIYFHLDFYLIKCLHYIRNTKLHTTFEW